MKNTLFPILTENKQKLPYYVFALGLDHVQEHVLRTDGYPCHQWVQCRSGVGRLLVTGKEYTIGKDQGMSCCLMRPMSITPSLPKIGWLTGSP